jgi:hypothetical protein
MTEPEQIWVLDWTNLDDEQAIERVEWLRENLEVGTDWGRVQRPAHVRAQDRGSEHTLSHALV